MEESFVANEEVVGSSPIICLCMEAKRSGSSPVMHILLFDLNPSEERDRAVIGSKSVPKPEGPERSGQTFASSVQSGVDARLSAERSPVQIRHEALGSVAHAVRAPV